MGSFGSILVLSLLASLALGLAGGCAHPQPEAKRRPSWIARIARPEGTGGARPARSTGHPPDLAKSPSAGRPRPATPGKNEAADLVAAALWNEGLRFGTDGTVAALWGYLRTAHASVPPAATRPGDILFFDSAAPSSRPFGEDRCDPPDHVGIAANVDDDGRVTFVEARDGRVRSSYVDATRPSLRRDPSGRILNTFLRPKKVTDRPDAPLFAGEMLCGIARPGR